MRRTTVHIVQFEHSPCSASDQVAPWIRSAKERANVGRPERDRMTLEENLERLEERDRRGLPRSRPRAQRSRVDGRLQNLSRRDHRRGRRARPHASSAKTASRNSPPRLSSSRLSSGHGGPRSIPRPPYRPSAIQQGRACGGALRRHRLCRLVPPGRAPERSRRQTRQTPAHPHRSQAQPRSDQGRPRSRNRTEAAALLERLPDFTHLEVRGLMTIAPWGVADDETRACFRSLRIWRDRWAAAHPRLSTRRALHGHERRFPARHRRRRNPHPHRHGSFRRAATCPDRNIARRRLMLRAVPAGVTLAVRAQPGAKQTAIDGHLRRGCRGATQNRRPRSPHRRPRQSRLIAFLADLFDLQRGSVELISGELSRSKVFLLHGMKLGQAERIVAPCLPRFRHGTRT